MRSKRPDDSKSGRSERQLHPEEQALWRFVTRHDVKWHDEDEPDVFPAEGTIPLSPPKVPMPLPSSAFTPKKTSRSLHTLESGLVIGIDRGTASRLGKGALTIDRTIDLHGMNQEQARVHLAYAIQMASASGHRVLLIITGKGTRGEGVLKKSLPAWLNDESIRPFILAFTRATPKDGGDGAFYILLKRQRHT